MYAPLKKFGASQGGLNIGIIGFGSLGQWATKIAKAMGNEVTVIMASNSKKELAKKLGVDSYVIFEVTDVSLKMQKNQNN